MSSTLTAEDPPSLGAGYGTVHSTFSTNTHYMTVACVSTRVMSCLPVFLQSGQDCWLLACEVGYKEIVHELLTKDKVDRNVVDEVRN